jgi:SET domain-containing protein
MYLCKEKITPLTYYKDMTTVRECVRCRSNKSSGGRCSRNTCKYAKHCWQHTNSSKKLKIADSHIEEAGVGLYTLKPIRKGRIITPYGGELMASDEFELDPSEYAVHITKHLVLDGRSTQSGLGRYVNDCRTEDRQAGDCGGNNAKIAVNRQQRTANIKATRNIRRGEEIFASYGSEYWGHPNGS